MKFAMVFLVFVLLFGAMVTVNKVQLRYGWKDAFFRTLLSPCEGTIWAPNFSIEAFEKVQISMTKTEVKQLLGEPLRKDCASVICLWIYSWQDTGTADFDQRWVIFDTAGRVSGVKKSFFID